MSQLAVPNKNDNRKLVIGQRMLGDIQGPFKVSGMHGARDT